MNRPNVFIGSSTEGLRIAEAIQLNLDHECETTLWSQGVFGLGQGTLEALVRAAARFDFAILVLSPDDLVTKREKAGQQPRDNVLFELGLFMGKLGRDRTFIVHERKTPLDLPSDLAGITPSTFARRTDNNMQAALGPVCTQFKSAMELALSRHRRWIGFWLSAEHGSAQLSIFKLGYSRAELYVTGNVYS